VKKVIPVSRLSRGEDKPSKDPTPGLLGTMAGGAAVSLLRWMGWNDVLGVDTD
jgi:20S proteasome subunit beta 5